MVLDQVQPEFPDEARGKVAEASVGVRVQIAATGRVKRAYVVQSSGVQALDMAAFEAAKRSTYLPAARKCKPIGGSYLFKVTFSSNTP